MSIISIPQDRFFSNFCKYADISQCFFVRPFFVNDAKNNRDRLNHSCRKTRFKNITIAHLNWFGPPEQFNMLWITVHFSSFKENKEIGTALTFFFFVSFLWSEIFEISKVAKQPQIKRRTQANMSLFHFISLAEQSGHCNRRQVAVCFPKSKTKRRRRGEYTRPLKNRLVSLPPLQTKPQPDTTPSLVIHNF